MIWLLGIFAWFVFGFFAVRMLLHDFIATGQDEHGAPPWALFPLGPLGWLIGMSCCEGKRARRNAHFIPKYPNALRFEMSPKIWNRLFLVRTGQSD